MRFGVLGSLDVRDAEGAAIDVGGNQPRTILAILVTAEERVVSSGAIMDALWGDEPPASALGTVQSYVSRLRRSFGGDGERLVSEPPGYRLAVEEDDVDFRRFERLVEAGRDALDSGEAPRARDLLDAALALWRGPALAEFAGQEFALPVITRLEGRRLAALEDRVTADLALGRHNSVLGELAALVEVHPLSEGLRSSLALALYRSGRQADALREIDRARRILADELGVRPGPGLRALEAAILAHDPALDIGPVTTSGPVAARAESTTAPAVDSGVSLAAGTGAGSTRDTTARIVGRDHELSELGQILDEMMAGAVRVAIIEGQPGIGKTRLAEELSEMAGGRGATVLWGRAFEGGATPALWPWLPPLRTLLQRHGDGHDEVDSIVRGRPIGDAPISGDARFPLFEAVTQLVADALEQPLVIVLDDLQWADVASLELLDALTGRLRDMPLLVVGTVRELPVGGSDELVGSLAELTRRPGTRRIHLRGLTGEATAQLVSRVATGADPATVAAISARAEGNPFFATELARLVAAGEPLSAVPLGVRDVVRRRLGSLPEHTRELLTLAAVVGRELDLELVSRAAGIDLDVCLDDLEPAVVQRLLVSGRGGIGALSFVHALVREVIVDDLSSLRRARLHLRVADALEMSDDTAEIIAEHLWEAAPIGVGARAAEALERAGDVAVRRYAYPAAQDLLERALRLIRTTGNGPSLEELSAIHRLVAVIGARHGRTALVGSEILDRGRRLAIEFGRQSELLDLLWVEWAGLDLANRYEESDRLARDLLDRAEVDGSPPATVLGHTAYGITCWHRGELAAAAEHLGLAAALVDSGAVQLGDMLYNQDQLKLSLVFVVHVRELMGDVADPRGAYEALVADADGDRYWELLVMNFASSSALLRGDVDALQWAVDRGLSADEAGLSAFWSNGLQCYRSVGTCLSGDVDAGLVAFEQALATYRDAGLRTNTVAWLASVSIALSRAGRVADAVAYAARAEVELGETRDIMALPTLVLARAATEHATGGDATARFQEAVDLAVSHGAHAVAAFIAREADARRVVVRVPPRHETKSVATSA